MNLATAIVVARANSQRLPGKALLPFAGSTLIGHKVRTLLRCKLVGRVVVGTDSYQIGREAMLAGADVVVRDDYHCDESRCSANEMIRDMVERVLGADDETYLWAHPTNPLVRPETYDRAIGGFCSDAQSWCGYDSLFSLGIVKRHTWFNRQPLNHGGSENPHRAGADLQPAFVQDGAIFIQTRARWLETQAFYGRKPCMMTIPWHEGWDIDTAEDMAVARALWEHRCESQSSVAAPHWTSTPDVMTLASLSA